MECSNLTQEDINETCKRVLDESLIVSVTDENGVIVCVNESFCEITGYSREELIGKTHSIVRHPDMPASFFKEMWVTLKAGKIYKGVIQNRRKNGTDYFISTTILPIFKQGAIAGYMSVRYDLTPVFESKKMLKTYTTDPLTLLPNQTRLLEILRENIGREKLLAQISINHFDEICSIYGDAIGDEFIAKCAVFLKGLILDKEGVILFKLDGNIFAILTMEPQLVKKYDELLQSNRLLYEGNMLLSQELNISVAVSFTVGYAIAPRELFTQTKTALRTAQKEHKACLKYQEDVKQLILNKENIEKLKFFKTALENDNIVPYLQPIISAKNGQIKKYEANARAIDESGNIFSPMAFLGIAKESNLYNFFTLQMARKVFNIAHLNPEINFSLNLSFSDIADKEIFAYIENRLKKFPDAQITFEILESEEITNYEILERFITMVKNYNCQVAIDDFGSGYSNFANIGRLNIDYIKIDGSIVSTVLQDEDSATIIKAICYFAKMKKVKTVAEFVSSQEIAQALKELDIDFYQGYYFGTPKPPEGYGLRV
ncbi:MAG: bifunctional diguanylate cyclase/phosphodiesterase [Helicobacteraceae bacterium]